MTYANVETIVHGKWILAGEHAVIRGFGALIFPIPSQQLRLQFNPLQPFTDPISPAMQALLQQILDYGMGLINHPKINQVGYFHIENNIPVGVGMGASAALCVVMARWFAAQKFIENNDVALFAKRLEDQFHGKSSGADIAGVCSQHGIYFRQGQATPLSLKWAPYWYLSFSGHQSKTTNCVQQVYALQKSNPTLAQQLDEQMQRSVELAQQALNSNSPEAILELAKAINMAHDCFQQWGLCQGRLAEHLSTLKNAGALAAKPTGSGGGGYVISLWNSPPPDMNWEMLAI